MRMRRTTQFSAAVFHRQPGEVTRLPCYRCDPFGETDSPLDRDCGKPDLEDGKSGSAPLRRGVEIGFGR